VKRSNRLLILIGFVLAACAFVGVVLIANNSAGGGGNATSAPTPTPEKMTTVVVASVDINLGDKITAQNVKTKQVTISEKIALGPDTYSTTDEVIGMVAGGSITASQPLHSGTDFLPPGSMAAGRSIAGGIAPDMLGMSMEVDQINGVGTLIVGGDHVDVILAMRAPTLKISGVVTKGKHEISVDASTGSTSKLILQNRKVLTVLLPQAEAKPEAGTSAAPAKTSATISNNGQHMIVILEVTPQEAEIIRYAQREEADDSQNYISLGLALRSDKDNDKAPVTTTGITFARMVQLYGVLPPDSRAIIPTDLLSGIQW
jgi:Flp pilus assembly protein CpaB